MKNIRFALIIALLLTFSLSCTKSDKDSNKITDGIYYGSYTESMTTFINGEQQTMVTKTTNVILEIKDDQFTLSNQPSKKISFQVAGTGTFFYNDSKYGITFKDINTYEDDVEVLNGKYNYHTTKRYLTIQKENNGFIQQAYYLKKKP